jgi:hypothetical protein
MHCMPLRTATLMLVARHRTMAWQSLLSRVVRAPTSSCRGVLRTKVGEALADAVLVLMRHRCQRSSPVSAQPCNHSQHCHPTLSKNSTGCLTKASKTWPLHARGGDMSISIGRSWSDSL